MKALIKLVLFCVTFWASVAHADVVLIKKSQIGKSDGETTLHRYEGAISQLNADSDRIADRIMNRERYLAMEKSEGSGGLQVTLMPARHR